MQTDFFTDSSLVSSTRILYTPSLFARSSLFHLQETGTLQALHPHASARSGLASFLFFIVDSGNGTLTYGGKSYDLAEGDCVFIDCRSGYEHRTGKALWTLSWCHFYGPNLKSIYTKYEERGGKPVFHPEDGERYRRLLKELYEIAGSADYVRDMKIHEKLSSLFIFLMEDAWEAKDEREEEPLFSENIQEIKEYLDRNFRSKISLDSLAGKFFINKFYLSRIFKERYGTTIGTYLLQARVTYAKQQLRFTDRTLGEIAEDLQMEMNYLSRIFKKAEGVSPSVYRKQWRGSEK